MKNFEDLRVWQKSHALVLAVYRVSTQFPVQERFGLIPQIRRAVVSIAANIVEGAKRSTDRDFAHFLNIAEGSLEEVKYYLVLTRDLDYITPDEYGKLAYMTEETGRLLHAFIKKLKA